jgi:rhodanese-related sulfurtransferase
VTRDELTERLGRRSVRLIDVGRRSSIERHIPRALSIPVVALPQRLDALPKRGEIVAHCRGPYCVMAYEAVEILRPADFQAQRLEGGFMEWLRAGLPLVRAEDPARLET